MKKIHSTNRQMPKLCAASAAGAGAADPALCWTDQHRARGRAPKAPPHAFGPPAPASPRPASHPLTTFLSVPKEYRCTPNFYAPSPGRDMRISSTNTEPEVSHESDAITTHRRSPRPRQRVGSLLIWAGARLMGDQQAPLELAQK